MVKPKASGRGGKRANTGGKRPGSGRKPGTPNKITMTVKMMLLAALEQVGGIKYFKQQSKENPTAFMSLLSKVMPTQVVGDVTHRYVARLPAVEGNAQEWLKKYSPPPPELTKH